MLIILKHKLSIYLYFRFNNPNINFFLILLCMINYSFLICRPVKMGLLCRYYSQKYPEVEDVVMVNVRSIAEMGAYVHLLEYNDIEGMILLSELSRRRIRSINKLIRVGRNECVVVIRVDKDKGILFLFFFSLSNI